MAIRLATIALFAFFSFVTITLTFIWRFVESILTVLTNMATSLLSGKGIVVITVLAVVYGVGFGLTQVQELSMEWIDSTYECTLEPVAEFSFSAAVTLIRQTYEFFVINGWNAGVSFIYEIVNDYIASIKMLGTPDTVAWYIGFWSASYDFVKALGLFWLDVPGWQIPFGVTEFFRAWVELWVCWVFDISHVMQIQVMGLTYFCNHCIICDIDPTATCLIREQLVPTFPPAVPATCIGCHTADCEIIRCIFTFIDDVTEVIQINIGVNFSPLLEDLSDATCCIFTNLYLPPIFMATGLLENLILGSCSIASPANIPAFVVNHWLGPFAQCIIDFADAASGGIIDNIFVDIFSVFFPFIQDVVTTFQTSALCFGTDAFVNCIENYPFTCSFAGLNPIPNGGLYSCFQIYGNCVINGVPNGMGGFIIEPAPLFQAGNFPDLFITVIPNIFRFAIDFTICNFVAFVDCVTPGQPGYNACVGGGINLGNFFSVGECLATCVESNVPFFSPIAGVMADFLGFLDETLDDLLDFINDVCNIVNNIPGISCLRTENMRGQGLHVQMKWTESLDFYNVTNATFCGHLLWTLPSANVSMDKWGDYMAVYFCLNLYGYGISRLSREAYENSTLKMDDFLSPISFMHNLPVMADEFTHATHGSVHNNTSYEMKTRRNSKFDYGRYLELKAKKMESTDKTIPMKELRSILSGISDIWNEKPYAHLISGYTEDVKSIQHAIDVLEGRIPKEEARENPEMFNSTEIQIAGSSGSGILQEYGINVNQIDIFDPTYAWKRANHLHNLYTVRDEINLRFASAMNNEFQRRRTLMPWYARRDAGQHGRDYYERKAGKSNIWKNVVEIHNATASATKGAIAKRIEYDTQISSYRNTGYKIYTKEELEKRRSLIRSGAQKVGNVLKSGKSVIDALNHDDGLAGRAFRYFDVEHWAIYQNTHMLLHVISEKDYANFSKQLNGEIMYLAEEGFVTHDRYHQIMEENRNRTERPLFKFFTGHYNQREKRIFGPFVTDPDRQLLPEISKVMAMHTETYEKARLKRMEFLGLTPDMPEAQGANLIFAGDQITDFIFDVIEFFVNDVFGTIFHLFTGTRVNLDLQGMVDKIFNFFSGITVDTGTVEKAADTLKDFSTCVLPEDIDGTNVFNPFCFPHLPENGLSWLRPFPNQFATVQIPWPSEFIDQDCVNTFNGNQNLFFFELSDNCGSMDGQPRPLCPVCDYCQRTYNSCLNIPDTVNDPLDTFFFLTGMIPVALDQFFTGGIRTDQLFQFAVILGALFMLTTAPITVLGPQIVGTFFTFFGVTFVIYTIDKLFGFFFPGEGGGLPFAVIYIALLFFFGFFFPEVFTISLELSIFLIFFAVLWGISLVFPFPSFNEQFNINWFLESFFTGLNYGPTPFKLINWSGFITRSQLFNYHTNPIPFVDIACFFWTFGNVSLLVAFGYASYWFIYWLWLVFLALVIYAFAFFGLIFATISTVRQWMRTQTLRILGEKQEDILEQQKKFKKEFERVKKESIPDWIRKNKWYKAPPTAVASLFGKMEDTNDDFEFEFGSGAEEGEVSIIETDSDAISDTIGFSTRPVVQRKHQMKGE